MPFLGSGHANVNKPQKQTTRAGHAAETQLKWAVLAQVCKLDCFGLVLHRQQATFIFPPDFPTLITSLCRAVFSGLGWEWLFLRPWTQHWGLLSSAVPLLGSPNCCYAAGGISRWGLSSFQHLFTPENTQIGNPRPRVARWLGDVPQLHGSFGW